MSDSFTGFTKFTFVNEEPPGYMSSGRAPDEDPSNQTRFALRFGLACGKQLRNRKSKKGLLRSQSWTMLGNWEGYTSSNRKAKSIKKPLKTQETRNSLGSGHALQDGDKKAFSGSTRNCGAHESTTKHVESTFPRNHDDHVAERGFNSLTHLQLGA